MRIKKFYSHNINHFTGKKRAGRTMPRKKKGVVKTKRVHKNKYEEKNK